MTFVLKKDGRLYGVLEKLMIENYANVWWTCQEPAYYADD
jgi:hypothetical protein